MNPLSGAGGAGSINQVMALRQQIIDRSSVLQELHQNKDAAPAETTPAQETGGFADSLRTALDGVNAAQQRSGDITAAYERGEVTDIAKVMLARQEAGVAFEATLQVRNKLLSAYQEIMRMGV
ncbi:flagellar hook-basal body complex protein FliE [Citromicrobium bathyomarinum]|jgi:flagellar hook-basal body complex protein FliE|uniref:flagellar hook-basal body complex protein FliE n=1 Tax=Sphingomonadales TaxID=204457 RepID=UPI000C52E169|nr:flagellar hook-basal body complex protein FliE [Citromicrobium sp.]|tara:strand:- start:251 stop:619 length:369 start_codon:yes stop_codon:yes gene_type:complete